MRAAESPHTDQTALLARLVRRFDHFGAELGQQFAWKDAFKNKSKAIFGDLDWERVGALFNAAAAYSYCACAAQPRGTHDSGLKEAARLFQLAAGCLSAAHDLTKDAIWGLTPRWDPAALTVDVRLEMLCALRDLMLAQAQRCYYEKAVGDAMSPKLLSRIAAQARRATCPLAPRLLGHPEAIAPAPHGTVLAPGDRLHAPGTGQLALF